MDSYKLSRYLNGLRGPEVSLGVIGIMQLELPTEWHL